MRARRPDVQDYVERDGVRVFYEVYGSGPATTLMLPTWSVLHSAHGRFQLVDLSRHYKVVTFDGRGNGRSDRPKGRAAYAGEEFVRDADEGSTWVGTNNGLGGCRVIQDVVVDPRTPGTLYARVMESAGCTAGSGLFKSIDGGQTWRATGLTRAIVSALAIDPRTSTTLYAISRTVRKSTDGGVAWQLVGRLPAKGRWKDARDRPTDADDHVRGHLC